MLRQIYESKRQEVFGLLVDHWLHENEGFGIYKKGFDYMGQFDALMQIEYSTFPIVMQCVLAGNLPIVYRERGTQGDELRRALGAHQQRSTSPTQPFIYANYLVDVKGCSPTYQYLATVTEDLAKYLKDPDFAVQVDNVVFEDAQRGEPKYISIDSATLVTALNKSRSAFRNRMKYDIAHLGYAKRAPIPPPLSQWGFTSKAPKRERSHGRHEKSNWLMNLVESLCQMRLGKKHAMTVFVVYCIPFPELSAIAETFFSVIGQACVDNDGGFSCYPAGLSINSATKLTEEEKPDNAVWMLEHVPWRSNQEELLRPLKERNEAAKAEMKAVEIERLAMDDAIKTRMESCEGIAREFNAWLPAPNYREDVKQRLADIDTAIKALKAHVPE